MRNQRYHFIALAITLAAVLFASPVAAQENLITDPTFATGGAVQPSLAAWQIDPRVGGTLIVAKQEDKPVLRLNPEQTDTPTQAVTWTARAAQKQRIVVIPGRKYLLRAEVLGEGSFALGMIEYGDKYEMRRAGEPSRVIELTPQWQTCEFTYEPTGDAVMYAAPYFQVTAWHGRALVRNPSLVAQVGKGDLTLAAKDFVVAAGQSMPVQIGSAHFPVKLLVYGPDPRGPAAVPGAGGSHAWTDHFKRALDVTGANKTAEIPIDPTDTEGTWRIVAVDRASGASARTFFTVRPAPRVEQERALIKAVELPSPPEGARLVFVGDSLTALFPETNYVALLRRGLTWRFGDKVEVINAGVGGDTILRIAERLDKDVIAKKPTHVFLFEGANDIKRPYDPDKKELRDWGVNPVEYEKTLRDVIGRIRAALPEAKIVLMTVAPGETEFLEPFQNRARALGDRVNFFNMPEEVDKAVALQKRVAQDLGIDVIDTNAALKAYMQQRSATGSPQYAFVDDGVHLSEYGSREVMHAVLRYLGKR